MKKLLVTLVAAFIVTGVAFAANNPEVKTLKGRVVETVNGVVQPVQFAYVYCEGTTISAYTNENGEFALPIEKMGKYTVRFSHAGYAVIEKNVKVKKNTSDVDYKISKQDVLLTSL